MFKIYLDVCCLNRPFDSWEQDRIRMEGEAILSILEQVNKKELELISSEAVLVELEKMTNHSKRENILKILSTANLVVEIDDEIELRSQQIEKLFKQIYFFLRTIAY
jgi:tRNA nucleotidyltransferase/poly(A) polymerase